jgi:hypothetical protein
MSSVYIRLVEVWYAAAEVLCLHRAGQTDIVGGGVFSHFRHCGVYSLSAVCVEVDISLRCTYSTLVLLSAVLYTDCYSSGAALWQGMALPASCCCVHCCCGSTLCVVRQARGGNVGDYGGPVLQLSRAHSA